MTKIKKNNEKCLAGIKPQEPFFISRLHLNKDDEFFNDVIKESLEDRWIKLSDIKRDE